MNKLVLLIFSIFILSCSNSDGSLKSTYSSCKITSSEALFSSDRQSDLSQCWDASGDGYAAKGDAMQWCESQVNNYISNEYILGHTVMYAVESTFCKK